MAEQNGVAHLPDRINSLEGWQIVDSIDGRRFVGHVEDEYTDDLGRTWIRFSKCVEINPVSTTAMLVPQGPNPLDPRGQPGLGIQQVASDAGAFSTPLSMPCLPPWTTQKVGGCKVMALPGVWRDGLLKTLQGLEARLRGVVKDAERAASIARDDGPREKVQ